jgi:hypothetical protein
MLQKLGKLPPRNDPRTFDLADYISALPAAPALVDWTAEVPKYGMLSNDKLGCCVIAGMMHLAMQQRGAAGLPVAVPSDAEVIAAYSAIGGYVPGDPSTDCGCNMLDALNYWRQSGLVFGGVTHKITAFAAVRLHQPAELASALWLFGGTLDGYALPASVQGQVAWKAPHGRLRGRTAPGSWGGHCVDDPYDKSGSLEVVSWGAKIPVDAGFRDAYCDESYVVLTPEWIEANGSSPCGFKRDALLADLAAL